MAARPTFPKLVHHKPRNLARVKLAGRIVYLGKWGSDEAHAAYGRIVADCLAGRTPTTPTKPTAAPNGCTLYTVGELARDYMQHAEERYRKRGEQTSEVHIVRASLGFLDAYTRLPAAEFTAADLEAVRRLMIDYKSKSKHRAGKALSRPTINNYVSRIVRAFDRASLRQSIPSTVTHLGRDRHEVTHRVLQGGKDWFQVAAHERH